MMRTLGLVVLGSLALSSGASAEFFVCEKASRDACAATSGLDRVLPSSDPTQVTDPNCFQVPAANLDAQRTLLVTVRESHANGRCHAKVVGGLAVEMSPLEKEAVDTAIQAVLDEQQAYADAVANNDLCYATLDQLATAKGNLDAALQGDIDGITNIATAKTELADMMTRLTNALEKLMRCIRGRAGPPQQ